MTIFGVPFSASPIQIKIYGQINMEQCWVEHISSLLHNALNYSGNNYLTWVINFLS